MKRKTTLTLCLFLLFSTLPATAAEGDEEVNKRLNLLEQEIADLKAAYEAEIETLKGRLDTEEAMETRTGARHKAVPVGSYGGIMNPDISLVANVETLFTDDKTNPNRNRIRVKEVEIALQGYLYPGIRADIIPALEMEYNGDDVEVEIDLEEAYVTASQIPYVSDYVPLEIQGGRKFMNFGRLNPVHPHHWAFSDTPLVLANLFGEHNWFDDGVQASVTVSNPWDLYVKTTFGIWNGKSLGHGHGEEEGEEEDAHEHEGEEEEENHEGDHDEEGEEHDHEGEAGGHGEGETLDWDGHIFLSRTVLGVPFGRSADALVGYSLAWDEGRGTVLHGGDLTVTYRLPGTYRKIRWQNEFFAADIGEGDYTRYGGYSLVQVSLSKYLELGGRYDQSQFLDPDEDDFELAGTGFVTYYFTHALYLRGQYRFRKMADEREEHAGFIQLVFGLGPHSHRLQD